MLSKLSSIGAGVTKALVPEPLSEMTSHFFKSVTSQNVLKTQTILIKIHPDPSITSI